MLTFRNMYLNFWIIFLSLCVAYRFTFLIEIYQNSTVDVKYATAEVIAGLMDDLLVGFILISILLLFEWIVFKVFSKRTLPIKIISTLLKIILVLFIGLIILNYILYQKIFCIYYCGLTYQLLLDGVGGGLTPSQGLKYLGMKEFVFVLTPILIFLILEFCLTSKKKKIVNYYLICALFLVVSCSAIYQTFVETKIPLRNLINNNPFATFVADLLSTRNDYYNKLKKLPSTNQMNSVRIIDPIFLTNTNKNVNKLIVNTTNEKEWNVVMIVLESIGLPYVFDTQNGLPLAMPFFKELSKEGLWLNNNYTSGNSTSKGAFSILTGLYTSSKQDYFELRHDIKIPTVAAWLGPHYDSFFIMAGSLENFFRKNLVLNTGFKEAYDYRDIPAKSKYAENPSVDEASGVDFFLKRISAAKQPFIGVYWTDSTHHPYYDQGPEFRLSNNLKNAFSRYRNGMYAVDFQIKRIFENLKAKGLLDKTILIIVGDHGEGFGKHPDGWMHGRTLYEEQIKVPVLFWQPKLFKAEVVNSLTSSIDILPTLLSALSIPYDANFLQGEDVRNRPFSRKYVFVHSYQDEIAAISENNIKMLISFKKGYCNQFDLKKDPDEFSKIKCTVKEQEEALVLFHNYQAGILMKYNSALNEPNRLSKLSCKGRGGVCLLN